MPLMQHAPHVQWPRAGPSAHPALTIWSSSDSSKSFNGDSGDRLRCPWEHWEVEGVRDTFLLSGEKMWLAEESPARVKSGGFCSARPRAQALSAHARTHSSHAHMRECAHTRCGQRLGGADLARTRVIQSLKLLNSGGGGGACTIVSPVTSLEAPGGRTSGSSRCFRSADPCTPAVPSAPTERPAPNDAPTSLVTLPIPLQVCPFSLSLPGYLLQLKSTMVGKEGT